MGVELPPDPQHDGRTGDVQVDNVVTVPDIEDLQFMRGLAERAWSEPAAPKTLSSTTRSVTPTRRARPSKEVYAKQSTVSRRDRDELGGGMVPGMQTVFIKTQGCAHNVSDGEYMAGLLASYGYEITEEWSDQVDVFLFNSCTVKGPSQDSFLNMVAKAKQSGAPIVVAGCVPQGEPGRDDFEGVSIIGTQQIHRVVEVVEEAINGNTVKLLGQSVQPALELPKIRRNALVEIVPISMGCLNRCTYCKTKHARGDLVSYSPQSLVSRVETVVQEGVREVWLSSEDTGAYGKDIDVPLPQLLDAIVGVIPDGVMLRIGMTNPPHILEHMQEVARVLNHPRVFKFLHIPVQCGSNKVLADMKREYTREDFEELVDYLLAHVPHITIATDVICGFPTETEEDFQETMTLLDKYKFPVVNIAQFYPRPGTAAAKLKKLQGHVVKERSRLVTNYFHSYSTWDWLVGTEQVVSVIEYGKDPAYVVGHSPGYTQVLLPRDPGLLGRQVRARITVAEKWCVKGEVVQLIEHATPLPQISIGRPNLLPSPSQLKATPLTVVPEDSNARALVGGEVREDYGDDDVDDPEVRGSKPATALAEAASQVAASQVAANSNETAAGAAHLRQRAGRGGAASPVGGGGGHGDAGGRQGASGGKGVREGGKETGRAHRGEGGGGGHALGRWAAVLVPMMVLLCYFEPVLTCFGAVVSVWFVGARRAGVGGVGERRRVWEPTRTYWVREEPVRVPARADTVGVQATVTGAGAGGCCGGGEREGCRMAGGIAGGDQGCAASGACAGGEGIGVEGRAAADAAAVGCCGTGGGS